MKQHLLIENLKKTSSFDAVSEQSLMGCLDFFSIEKNKMIIGEGDACQYIYFIAKGCVRTFYDKNGKDITEWFALENEFFTSFESLFEQTPTHLRVQALEKTELVGIHYARLLEQCKNHHELETLLRKMLAKGLILSQKRMMSLQFETAQQRYEHLISTRPEIVQRVQLTHIASFLGITLETLSRIRSK
jgi:CRP-like cAMP-binding protein